MEGAPLVFEAPISRPVVDDLELEYLEEVESDGASSAGSESDYIDATECEVSDAGVSEITGQTEATTVGDADDVDRAHFRGCDSHDQELHKLDLTTTTYTGQNFIDGEVTDFLPGSTGTGTDKDQLSIKLEQDVGSGRHYRQLGTSDEAQGPGAEEATGTPANAITLWRNHEERTSEARMAFQGLRVLAPGPNTGGPSQGTNTPLHGTSFVFGPFRALPSEEYWDASALLPNAARQVRLNLVQGRIHRLMPITGNIDFDVDRSSFVRAQIPQYIIDRVIAAAVLVAQYFTSLNLGIAFAYAPGARRRVFCISCDPSISAPTLALAPFPSDRRGPRGWYLRISPYALEPYHFHMDPDHMVRTLAHEFMHILGFRHWTARSDEDGTQLQSMRWPGTRDDRNSIMHTEVNKRLWFYVEDVQALQGLYLQPNGTLVRGRWEIRDVDPYNGH